MSGGKKMLFIGVLENNYTFAVRFCKNLCKKVFIYAYNSTVSKKRQEETYY